VLHIRGAILDSLFKGKEAKVRELDHPSGVYQAVGSAQGAVESNGRVVQIDDALKKG